MNIKRLRPWTSSLLLSALTACGGETRDQSSDVQPDDASVEDTFPSLPDGTEDTLPSEDTDAVDSLSPSEDVGGDADTDADVSTEPELPEPSICQSMPFEFGCPCDANRQCESGWCIQVDDDETAMRCSRSCVESCPEGWECRGVATGSDPVFICQPQVETLCLSCERDADCKTLNAKCLSFPDGTFCGQACERDSDCPSDFACGDIYNAQGQITGRQCRPRSGSCLCPEGTDYQSDLQNCGLCGNACEDLGAEVACIAGQCEYGTCMPGFIDLNQSPSDGCEYACTPRPGVDLPDAQCATLADCDSDCDGLDGSIALGLFVSPTGSDESEGTRTAPLRTIEAALARADGVTKSHIYVAAGSYSGELRLKAGISLFGGYSADGTWQRDLVANPTILTNQVGTTAVRVLIAEDIQAPTIVDGFEVLAGNNANPGGSSYAIWVRNSTSELRFSNLTAVGGNGGSGLPGGNGLPGANGNYGVPGIQGSKNCNDTRPQGGVGGSHACTSGVNSAGGRGGAAGCDSFAGSDTSPANGTGSPGGASGGQTNGVRTGGHGSSGSNGTDGSGGNTEGALLAGLWRGLDGVNGLSGTNGIGGGGGAGGAGGVNIMTGRWGGSGGGGGSGGCGGQPGLGGQAGGGSFGVFLVDASPTLERVLVGHKHGGNGGNGGTGGTGGVGRTGGAGGAPFDSHAQAGAAGGTGGNGGRGGHGGGGAGGIAYGLYLSGSSDPRCHEMSFGAAASSGTGGLGGVGANGEGNRGADGAYGARNHASSSCP